MNGSENNVVVETPVVASVETVAPVETPVTEPVTAEVKAKKTKAKKVKAIKVAPVAEKNKEKVLTAEEAQEARRKELAEAEEKARQEREAAKVKRGRGRPPVYTPEHPAYALIVLLLTRFGATGARRRLSAVANGEGAEKGWRADTVAAWKELNGEGKAPILPRISLPTLLSIAEDAKLVLKKGRPAKVA